MTPAQLPRTELPTLGWSGRNSAVLEYLVVAGVAALGGYWAWAKVPDWPWAVGCAALVLVLLGRLTRHQAIEWGPVPVLLQYRVLLPSRRIPLDAGTRVRAMSRSTTTGLTLLRGRQRAHVRLWRTTRSYCARRVRSRRSPSPSRAVPTGRRSRRCWLRWPPGSGCRRAPAG